MKKTTREFEGRWDKAAQKYRISFINALLFRKTLKK